MWKNIVELGRPQTTIWRMRILCRIPKATNTNSQYVTIFAVPLYQRLQDRISTSRRTHTACTVVTSLHISPTNFQTGHLLAEHLPSPIYPSCGLLCGSTHVCTVSNLPPEVIISTKPLQVTVNTCTNLFTQFCRLADANGTD